MDQIETITGRIEAARALLDGAHAELLAVLHGSLTEAQREVLDWAEQSLDDIYLPGIVDELGRVGREGHCRLCGEVLVPECCEMVGAEGDAR